MTPIKGQRGTRRPPERGFTLIEALIVLALLGIVVAFTASALRSVKEKTELEGAVNTLRGLIDRAPTVAARERTTAIVRYNANARRFDLLYRDSSGNVRVVDSYTLPAGVVFDGVTPTNWPTFGSDRAVGCHPLGNLIDPSSQVRLLAPLGFRLTLDAMNRGTVKPKTSYLIQVFPVWSCRVTKIRQ